jgi:hypothetical protein
MSRKYLVILILAVAVILFILLALKWVYKPAKTSVGSEKAVAEITATKLVFEFGTDEQKANQAYLGKVIVVSGVIDSVTEDSSMITVTLKNPDDIAGVICSFNKNTVNKAAFSTGQQTKIKGKCDGYLLDVVLTKCSFVE